jgi:hypothetical protein
LRIWIQIPLLAGVLVVVAGVFLVIVIDRSGHGTGAQD